MRKGRLHSVLGLLIVASMLAVAVPAWAQTATTLPSTTVTTGFTFGLDVNQPFTDKEASSAPGKKILTSWVAVGNRLDDPLPFSLKDLKLEDAHGNVYTSTVKPIWAQPLQISVIGPHEVVGGYVSWEVPFYLWPTSVVFM